MKQNSAQIKEIITAFAVCREGDLAVGPTRLAIDNALLIVDFLEKRNLFGRLQCVLPDNEGGVVFEFSSPGFELTVCGKSFIFDGEAVQVVSSLAKAEALLTTKLPGYSDGGNNVSHAASV